MDSDGRFESHINLTIAASQRLCRHGGGAGPSRVAFVYGTLRRGNGIILQNLQDTDM